MTNWTRVGVEVDWAKLMSHPEFGLTADATYSSTTVSFTHTACAALCFPMCSFLTLPLTKGGIKLFQYPAWTGDAPFVR